MSTFDEWWEQQVRAKPPYTPKEMARAAWNAALANLPVFEQVKVNDEWPVRRLQVLDTTPSKTVVHILHTGFTLCGIHPVNNWPHGDKWVPLELSDKATCSACTSLRHRQRSC